MPIIVTRDFPPGRGGIQRYCSGLAMALHDAGSDVCVIAPEQEGDTAYDADLPYRVVRIEERGRLVTGIATVRAIRKAKRQLADKRVIAAIWQPCAYEAMLSGSIGSSRPIIICHGSEITKQRNGFRRIAATLVLRAGDAVAVSRFTAGAVRRLGAEARVVPMGVPQNEFDRRPSPEPRVLIVGRLVRRKGFDRMIRAVADLAASFPGLTLDIVGDGPDLEYLRRLIDDLDVGGNVRMHGSIGEDRLAELYETAWFFAMPNRTEAGYDVEGLGIVFLEAAMHGIPSIGGRRSGAEDAIIDGVTGLLVDGDSQDEVTEAVRSLVSDRSMVVRLGDAARRRVVEEFDWSALSRQLLARSS